MITRVNLILIKTVIGIISSKLKTNLTVVLMLLGGGKGGWGLLMDPHFEALTTAPLMENAANAHVHALTGDDPPSSLPPAGPD